MLLIKNGYLLDPQSGREGNYDILIKNKQIVRIDPCIRDEDLTEDEHADLQIIHADHMMVAPGLVDVHVHFRDPGFTYKEDIYTGAEAAAKGGFTTVVLMANTKPTVDNPDTLQYVLDRAVKTNIHVRTCASITKGLKGQELTDMAALKKQGAVGFTDDGIPMLNEDVVKAAMQKAKELNVPLSFHEENPELITNNGINHGKASEHYGIGGSPRVAEIDLIARDLSLAAESDASINIQHISSKEGVELVRQAKLEQIARKHLTLPLPESQKVKTVNAEAEHIAAHKFPLDTSHPDSHSDTVDTTVKRIPMDISQQINIHSEATPHHFSLTEDAVIRHGALAKMNPPLRTEQDRQAIIRGLQDNTIDIIATDHAPHSAEEKAKPITEAPSGIIGLETALSLGITNLVKAGHLSYMELLEKMTINPAAMYHLDCGYLAEGGPADLIIFNENSYTVEHFCSKSENSPFKGKTLIGEIQYTICNGRIVYEK